MRITVILILTLIWLTPGLAKEVKVTQKVDLTKAYIITPEPVVDKTAKTLPTTLQIGGIKTIEIRRDDITELDWKLLFGFGYKDDSCTSQSQKNTSSPAFHLLKATPQNRLDPQVLQQQLRGTVWSGDYKTSQNIYDTKLWLQVVQEDFVGGEIIHTVKEEPEPSSFFNAKVTGNIVTQFLIEGSVDNSKIDSIIARQTVEEKESEEESEEENVKVWVSVAGYEKIVKEIKAANKEAEKKSKKTDKNEPIQNPKILHNRLLIRLKRARNIGSSKSTGNRWGSYHEYRLTFENGKITGSAGIPPKNFGSKDTLTGIGDLELEMFEPKEAESGSE